MRRPLLPIVRRLRTAEDGVTIAEFAVVGPVMCLFLVGALDVAHTLYMQAALEGAVQKAGRDSGLETGVTRNVDGAIDNWVKAQVLALNNAAEFTPTRRYYRTFSQAAAAQEETFTDTNGDRICNNGEPYTDRNNNGVWDRDGADGGQGGAKDRVLYTVTVSYPRLLPLFAWIGVPNRVTMKASTILQNQPYGDQATYAAPTSRNCV